MTTKPTATKQHETANGWPNGRAVLVCAQAGSRPERQILRDWVRENAPAGIDVRIVHVPYAKGDDVTAIADKLSPALDAAGEDTLVLPIRVVWQDQRGARLPNLWEAALYGDLRHPRPQVQPVIQRFRPGQDAVVVAVPASVRELREAWRQGHDASTDAFPRFVARRLEVAAERAESQLLGPQHKVPRLVREEITTSSRFRAGLRRLAERLGRDHDELVREADAHLEGLVSGWSHAETDFNLLISRKMYEFGYEVDVDPTQFERVREIMRRHPTVTLSSHRSYMDGAILSVISHEYGLPRRHVLAGANMDFWPIGSIARRSGAIFIKRDSRDAPVYRYALREYLGYLVEKRFHLEWYIEGGRSRTGKMLPPKLGALAYVVDAYRDGRAEDVMLLPVSITYTQLREVGEFAGEAAGKAKQAENAGWLIRLLRKSGERYGKVYVRFGEPLSLRDALGPPRARGESDASDVDLQKVGLEVALRILQVTPATGTALLTMTLLTSPDRALTLPQLRSALGVVLTFADGHEMPMTAVARSLGSDSGLESVLDSLIHFGVVDRFDEGSEPVFGIGRGQHLVAAFYRNSIIHFFLNNALLELGLVKASRSASGDATSAFWDAAMAVRDLLKFDFFFQEKEHFRTDLSAELARANPDWQSLLARGPKGAERLLRGFRFPVAHATLRPFLEAYYVVATALVAEFDTAGKWDEKAFLKRCLALGRQMLLQKRIDRPESVSAQLFKPAIQLAEHRKLLGPDAAAAKGREQFRTEVRDALSDVDIIASIAERSWERLLAKADAL